MDTEFEWTIEDADGTLDVMLTVEFDQEHDLDDGWQIVGHAITAVDGDENHPALPALNADRGAMDRAYEVAGEFAFNRG